MADPHVVQMRRPPVQTAAKPNTTLYQIAMRYSGYYSSSDDEDSLFGSTGRGRALHKELLQKKAHQKHAHDPGEYVEVKGSRPSSRVVPPDVTQNGSNGWFLGRLPSGSVVPESTSDYMVMNGNAEQMLRRVELLQNRQQQ
ncbi:unnamed protein product, partial [Mesorhabditis spiculigera]